MMRGFLVAEFANDFKNASEALAEWVREDKIKRKQLWLKGLTKYQKHLEIFLQVTILGSK